LNSEPITLSNSTAVNNAAVAYTLTAHGNILVTTPANTGLTSPTISLKALGGNITADGTATGGHFQVNSGGTSGLSLFAKATTVSSAGGAVNILTTNSEAVTLANDTSPLSATVSFTIQDQGSLQASTASNTAIVSPAVSITMNTGSGNVGGDA